tara:strand:+ start:47 stop:646 length:600 start_codon:yes stop_codon:yes gene_type:complete
MNIREPFFIHFTNAGGITLMTKNYAHHYTDPCAAAEDSWFLLNGETTEDWNSNEPEHRLEPDIYHSDVINNLSEHFCEYDYIGIANAEYHKHLFMLQHKAELQSLQAENLTTAQAIAQMWGGDGQCFLHEKTEICIVEFCQFLAATRYENAVWEGIQDGQVGTIQEVFVFSDNSFLLSDNFWDIECHQGQVIVDGQIYK